MSAYQHLDDRGLASRASNVRMFVLIEASADRNLLARLEFHSVNHRSLWRLESQSELEKHAPYLCQIEPGGDFDTWLGDNYDKVALTWLFTRMSFDDLWQHLRRFNKFENEGRYFFLRIGSPGSLHLYVASIAHTPVTVARLFADGGIEEFYFHDPQTGLSQRVQPLFEQQRDTVAEFDGSLVWYDVVMQEAV